MEKKPLIAIDEGPLDVWYESPSVMVVKKPQGIAVHPTKKSDRGTLLNRIFQHNRWLAGMETDVAAGVLHIFEAHDHGLMLFNKSDDYQNELTQALRADEISFSYVITLEGEHNINLQATEGLNIKLRSQKQLAGYTIIDVQTSSGSTPDIRYALFPDIQASEITFYCYQVVLVLPHSGEKHITSIRESFEEIPNITVYHAPP